MTRRTDAKASVMDRPAMTLLTPRVRTVIEQLLKDIRSGRLSRGDRLPTVRRMAEQYDLSIRGVSQAVEHLEKIGLIERIHGSGCYIRSTMVSQVDTSASPYVYLFTMMDQPVAMEQLIRPLVDAAQAAGLLLSLINTCGAQERLACMDSLRESWVTAPPRAVVIKDGRPHILQQIERACPPDTRLITVFQGRSRANRRWHKIEPDEYGGYKLAAQWLAEQGCDDVALVIPDVRTRPNPVFQEHEWSAPQDAVRDAMLEASKPEPRLHITPTTPHDAHAFGMDMDNLRRLANLLQAKNAPTGIIAGTIRMQSVLLAADMAGRTIGDDLKVIGVGDRFSAQRDQYPCVSLGHEHVAARATQLMLADVDPSNSDVQHITIQPELIESPPRTRRDNGAD